MNRRTFLLHGLGIIYVTAQKKLIQPGDLLLTRNTGGESRNLTPGYYNHAAIFSIKNWVIEAHSESDNVICVPVWYFFKRYPKILVLRNPDNKIAQKTAKIATEYIGRKYDRLMTIRPLWKYYNSDSCVSLIRRIYNHVTKSEYTWLKPDHLALDSQFKQIAIHKVNNHKRVDMTKYAQNVWPNKDASYYYE